MVEHPAKLTTAEDVLAGLRRRQRAIVDAYMRELIPGYERHQERLADMREAGELVIGMLLRAMSEQRPITPDEFSFSRGYFRRAMLRGATEHELVRAARLWQRVVFDELGALAGPDGSAIVAELSGPLIDYVDVLSVLTADVVDEIQTAMRLTQRDGRAELTENLLAGRPLPPAGLVAARACGLADGAAIVVIAARPALPLPDPAAAAVAAVALAHAAGDALEPLFAVRGEEVVIVRATRSDPAPLIAALGHAQRRLAQDGVVLAVGVSAVHDDLSRTPSAYAEACLALEAVADRGGLLAIAGLDPLDYLFVRGGDDTAWSLVDPVLRRFVEDDLAQAGMLVDTFNAYLAANLNVKQAAERLFVHANTAHYRLAKIEEVTGRDLRNLMHLQELVVAVRLARGRTAAGVSRSPDQRRPPARAGRA